MSLCLRTLCETKCTGHTSVNVTLCWHYRGDGCVFPGKTIFPSHGWALLAGLTKHSH